MFHVLSDTFPSGPYPFCQEHPFSLLYLRGELILQHQQKQHLLANPLMTLWSSCAAGAGLERSLCIFSLDPSPFVPSLAFQGIVPPKPKMKTQRSYTANSEMEWFRCMFPGGASVAINRAQTWIEGKENRERADKGLSLEKESKPWLPEAAGEGSWPTGLCLQDLRAEHETKCEHVPMQTVQPKELRYLYTLQAKRGLDILRKGEHLPGKPLTPEQELIKQKQKGSCVSFLARGRKSPKNARQCSEGKESSYTSAGARDYGRSSQRWQSLPCSPTSIPSPFSKVRSPFGETCDYRVKDETRWPQSSWLDVDFLGRLV